ncbi:MAG: hypothetical protein P8Y23_17695, partial [Candidatus Lokiarchaeota archaeon]
MGTKVKIDNYDGYESKDNLFDIIDAVKSSPSLLAYRSKFYQEIKLREYHKAYGQYMANFVTDFAEQVLATLVAGGISLAITSETLGFGTAAGHVAYFIVYSLLSKYFMDVKTHKARSYQLAQDYFSVEGGKKAPTKLNQRVFAEDFWAESMVSAIAGHPGAYYTTATGGDLGHQYTAEIMVSPPNYERMLSLGNSLLNFFDTIATAFTFGLNPDFMFGLRFDSHNLNYQMATSELYSYNDEKDYFYTEDPSLLDRMYSPSESYPDPLSSDTSYSSYSSYSYSPYSTTGGYTEYMTGPESAKALLQLNDRYNYRSNSLGGAIYRVIKASDSKLTTITPRIGIDSYGDYYPYYQFTAGSETYAEDTYLSNVLYEPLVVSPDRYSY